jgi:intraflagellar transport protein 172
MYIGVKKLKEAFVFGRENFTPEELEALCERCGRELEKAGSLEDAERIYIEIKKPESAIKMYKTLGQFDKMLRMFSIYRPENLKEAHNWIGKRQEEDDQLAGAEKHYLEAGSWTSAVDMYEKRKMFEDCLRICKNFASDRDTVERAKRWDLLISESELVELLRRSGLVGSLIDYFCEKKKFGEAFKAAEKAKHKLPDIHLNFAMHLEDERQYKEAEKEYILAGKYDQVVHMYVDIGDFVSAVQVARQHDHKLLEDIYLKQAKMALENNDLEKMELCFISAKKPELAVTTLAKLGHISDAIRVARKHCPVMVKELSQSIQNGDANNPMDSAADLEKQIRIWEEAREWEKVIDVCLEANESLFAHIHELENIWDKAIQVSFNYVPNRYMETVKIVCKRLRSLNRFGQAGDYYDSVQMHEEAVKCFLAANEIDKARQSCSKISDFGKQSEIKELIEKAFKNYLRNKKDAEQLVGNEEIREGLDLMAERGDWVQALSIAASKDQGLFEFYLLKYLNDSMNTGKFAECLKILLKFGMPPSPSLLDAYRKLVDETFALCDPNEIADLKLALFNFVQTHGDLLAPQERTEFENYLFVSHLNQLKQLFDNHKLKKLSADVAVSLVRYIHLMTIDKPFHDAGEALRAVDEEVEAFMYLNRYLDIYDLIKDPQGAELEESDEFRKTDIPDIKSLRIPAQNLISDADKDQLRDWLLSVSLKKQSLRFKERDCAGCKQKIYAKALHCPYCKHSSSACHITGLPVETGREASCGCCGKGFRDDAYKAYLSYFSHCPWCNKSLIK